MTEQSHADKAAEVLALTTGIVVALAPVLPTLIQLLQALLAHHHATAATAAAAPVATDLDRVRS